MSNLPEFTKYNIVKNDFCLLEREILNQSKIDFLAIEIVETIK